jgi:hypothetical protein
MSAFKSIPSVALYVYYYNTVGLYKLESGGLFSRFQFCHYLYRAIVGKLAANHSARPRESTGLTSLISMREVLGQSPCIYYMFESNIEYFCPLLCSVMFKPGVQILWRGGVSGFGHARVPSPCLQATQF